MNQWHNKLKSWKWIYFNKKITPDHKLKVWALNTETGEKKYCTWSWINLKNKWLDFQKKSINWQNDLDIILKEWDWFSSISDIIIKHLNKIYWIWSLEENSSSLFSNWIELSQSKIKEDIESNFLKKIDLSFWSIIDSDESEILYLWTSEETYFNFLNWIYKEFKIWDSTMWNGVCFSNNLLYCQSYCLKYINQNITDTFNRWYNEWTPILQVKLKQHKMLIFQNDSEFYKYTKVLKNKNFITEEMFQEDMPSFHLENWIKSIKVKNMYGYWRDEIVVFDNTIIDLVQNQKAPKIGIKMMSWRITIK